MLTDQVFFADDRLDVAEVDWRRELARAVRDPDELARLLVLPASLVPEMRAAAEAFPLCVPQPYLQRIRPGDPDDPLLRQVLPCGLELQPVEGFSTDPLGEEQKLLLPGVLGKYAGRLLILTTGSCAVHCRFCFRRHFPFKNESFPPLKRDGFRQIAGNIPPVTEVIWSGGDPLMLADDDLFPLVEQFASLPMLRRMRFHTRLPIMIPRRVNDDLLDFFASLGLPVFVVLHVNHPGEIDVEVERAISGLVDSGVTVLSQSVLLRGVNDDADCLVALFEQLIDLKVMPYYLHQLDRVAGAAHFNVPIEEGQQIMAELRRRLPGYAVPRYVRETKDGEYKEVLA